MNKPSEKPAENQDTPEAHWERFQAATKKAFALSKDELSAKLTDKKKPGSSLRKTEG